MHKYIISVYFMAYLIGYVLGLHTMLHDSNIYRVPSNAYKLRGKFIEYSYDSFISTSVCGRKCFTQEGCFGFAIMSYTCRLVLLHPGPNATYVSLGQDTELWMTNYPASCLDIKYRHQGAVSGNYWIMIDGTDHPVKVFCDMETVSGGWTLVWSYGFTNYGVFTHHTNAVEPIPSAGWTIGSTNVQISTTIPMNPRTHGAMEFALWTKIGKNFHIRSNINNEYMCTPGTGSIVKARSGSIACSLVNDTVQGGCTDTPDSYTDHHSSTGPFLNKGETHAIYWDGSTDARYPTHDPCGTNTASHITGVSNPGGQLYLSNYPTSCVEVKTRYPWVKCGYYWILSEIKATITEVYCN